MILILVVEDNYADCVALTAILKANGFDCICAVNGKEFIEKLSLNTAIKMILMDIMMPVMDGYQAIHEIRRLTAFRNLPIIAITARALPGDEEKCIAAGADHYLSKPLKSEELLKLLNFYYGTQRTDLASVVA